MTGGAYDHLHPAYRSCAALSDAERIEWIRADRWLAFDAAASALARLADLLAYPPRDRMPCLLIYGDTGMGKTKIIRKFLRDHPPSVDSVNGVTTMPVVAIQMPPEPIEHDLYAELLAGLGAPALAGGTTHRHKDVCRGLLRSMSARMLIIDEIHAMLAGTFRQQRVFLNAVRFLANDLRIPLVCAGTDLARQALLTDAQLAERFDALHLARWTADETLARLLASLTSIMPLRRPSNLQTAAVAKRVVELTDGVTVRIFRLIETAAVEAIRSGEERITLASLADNCLALPLVAMTRKIDRRLANRAPPGAFA